METDQASPSVLSSLLFCLINTVAILPITHMLMMCIFIFIFKEAVPIAIYNYSFKSSIIIIFTQKIPVKNTRITGQSLTCLALKSPTEQPLK